MGAKAARSGNEELADKMFNAVLLETARAKGNCVRLGAMLQNIAQLCIEQKRYQKAETFLRRALATYSKSMGQTNSYSPVVLDGLAYLSFLQEKYGQAAQYYERAVAMDEKLPKPDLERMAERWKKLAWLYTSRNKYQAAYAAITKSKELLKKYHDQKAKSMLSDKDFLVDNNWI